MTESHRKARFASRARALTIAAALCAVAPSRSALADQNWDGDNAVGNFSFNNNWFGDNQPGWGFGNGSLFFNFRNNPAQTSLFYDYGFYQNTNDIIWETTFNAALPWNGNGNGINFNQRLENRSSFTQTVNIPLSGAKNGAGQIEFNPVNGNLTLNASVFNDNNKPYFVFGGTGKVLTVNTALGGNSGVSFNIEQNNTVIFKQANTFGGEVIVKAGRLQFDTGGSVATTIRLGNTTGTASAAVDLIAATGGITVANTINPRSGTTGNTLSFNSQNTSGTNTYSGHFGLDHDLLVTQTAGGTLNITQAKGADNSTGFDIKSFTTTIQADGIVNVSGNVYNSTGSGNIVKTGSGTLSLSSSTNSYSGSTTVKAGVLLVGANAPSGNVGALGNVASNSGNSAVNLGDTSGSANASILTDGAFMVGRPITVQSGNTGVMAIGGNTANTSTFSGAIGLGTALGTVKDVTLVAAPGGIVDFSGVINESTSVSGVGNVTIGTATQTGTVKLSNVGNGYSGITTINSGATLEVTEVDDGGSNSSIGNANSAATNLVFSGGTLRYVGGGVSSTNRLFTFDANGATIDANAAVSFIGTGPLVASGTGNRTLTLTGSSTGSLASVIPSPSSGATSLLKSGGGAWTLSATTNTYTGTTRVTGGRLNVNGTHNTGGAYTVETGGTLGGTGTIGSSTTVQSGGTLSPGVGGSIGTINIAALTLDSGANYDVEFNAPFAGPVVKDLTIVTTGAVSLTGSSLNLSLVSGGSNGFFSSGGAGYAAGGLTYTIVDKQSSGAIVGTFAGLAEGAIIDAPTIGQKFKISYVGGNGNDVVLTTVPEPTGVTVALLTAGLLGRRRRRTRQFVRP